MKGPYPDIQGGGSLILAWQVRNKRILVVGGGEVAAGRIVNVLNADAKVTVVSPRSGLNDEVAYRIDQKQVEYIDRKFEPSDLDGVDMVLTAVDDPEASSQIFKLCKEKRIPANIADVPPECDFYFGSVHRDGPLQIMVSTNGNGPKLANIVRRQIADGLPSNIGAAVTRVGILRRKLRKIAPAQEEGPKRMQWMSKVCEQWSLDELCEMTEEDMEELLGYYKPNTIPSLESIYRDLATLSPYEKTDFQLLANANEDFRQIWETNNHKLDFHDPETHKTLTKAILQEDFGLPIDLPDDRLCPPIPNRSNYVAWIQRLLDSTAPNLQGGYDPQRQVIGLDIGTGASAIYTLLSLRCRPNWTMCATDIDKKSFDYASRNLAINNMMTRVKLLQTLQDQPLIPLQYLAVEKLDFTICNPPFFLSHADMHASLEGEDRKRKPPAVCTGAEVEMVCEGGDLGFVTRIVNESLVLRDKVTWLHGSGLDKEMGRSLEFRRYASRERHRSYRRHRERIPTISHSLQIPHTNPKRSRHRHLTAKQPTNLPRSSLDMGSRKEVRGQYRRAKRLEPLVSSTHEKAPAISSQWW
ncbi:siroheme synthase [Aaosphaeria arxii CBS 175.79]|uniref:precorrin-2 dehydrogenase n=1 Tax=Aaosphaeria arxii CBS 175.79 TaxID=1450172 RepID=A0A6A5XN46_9PLEO|nr:siroheme synthase [Aaosphaeria arxii CBS 175.79]KAF2014316.1 siroheme synthase [Aaosphaeria arxii CBS 175.79]